MIRYGIIGTGMMGWEHIRNIALIPDAAVTAIADPDPGSRAGGRSAAGDDVAVFEDHRALMRSKTVDAVVIASPNHTHADVLRDILASEVHVLGEKPLCTTIADCRRLVESCERRRALVWVGLEYRFVPTVARLIEAVRAGAVGQLR